MTELDSELEKIDSIKLEKYMRSRWATVLFTLKEVTKKMASVGTSKKVAREMFFAALKEKIKEKIVFELTNPSLAKIMRSKTPPADAPRKIREEYRKAHPEEEDHFPDIVLQLSKVELTSSAAGSKTKEDKKLGSDNTKSNATEDKKKTEKAPTLKEAKRGSSFATGTNKALCKFPYRSTLDNPKYDFLWFPCVETLNENTTKNSPVG